MGVKEQKNSTFFAFLHPIGYYLLFFSRPSRRESKCYAVLIRKPALSMTCRNDSPFYVSSTCEWNTKLGNVVVMSLSNKTVNLKALE